MEELESLLEEKEERLQRACNVIEKLREDFQAVVKQLEVYQSQDSELELRTQLKMIKQLLDQDCVQVYQQPQLRISEICYKDEMVKQCKREDNLVQLLQFTLRQLKQMIDLFQELFQHQVFLTLDHLVQKLNQFENYLEATRALLQEEAGRYAYLHSALKQDYLDLGLFMAGEAQLDYSLEEQLIYALKQQQLLLESATHEQLKAIQQLTHRCTSSSQQVRRLELENSELRAQIARHSLDLDEMKDQQQETNKLVELFEQSLIDLEVVNRKKEIIEKEYQSVLHEQRNLFDLLNKDLKNAQQFEQIHPFCSQICSIVRERDLQVTQFSQYALRFLKLAEESSLDQVAQLKEVPQRALVKLVLEKIKNEKSLYLNISETFCELSRRMKRKQSLSQSSSLSSSRFDTPSNKFP